MAAPMLQPTNGTMLCLAPATETTEATEVITEPEATISRADHNAIAHRIRNDALKVKDSLQRHIDHLELELARARLERHDFKIQCDHAGCVKHLTITSSPKLEGEHHLAMAASVGWSIGTPTRERSGWPVHPWMTSTVDLCNEHSGRG